MNKTTGSLLKRADYIEDYVAVVLERFLNNLVWPDDIFSIELISRSKERGIGVDALLNGAIQGFRPFYMQFKRPSAYPSGSKSRIITDRKKLSIDSEPHALFFRLRDKKPEHSDYQHNVLYHLREELLVNGLGEAAYVCPLFLDRSTYRSAVHRSGLSLRRLLFFQQRPWVYGRVLVHQDGGPVRFDRIPVLAKHVTIPPHIIVNSSKHHYSFNEQGRDLCFHEPTALGEDASATLATFLTREIERFRSEDGKVSLVASDGLLNKLIVACYGEEIRLDDLGNTQPDRWFTFGSMLWRHFRIVQYAMVG